MSKEIKLPWGEPWHILFKRELNQEERKAKMAEIASRLYKYIEESLGSKEYFTLQLNWSRSAERSNIFLLDVHLIVSHEGIVNWQKTKPLGFEVNPLATIQREGTKPPPPPPPPPRDWDIFQDDPAYEYFSNNFIPSHVLAFSRTGKMTQFFENLNEATYK